MFIFLLFLSLEDETQSLSLVAVPLSYILVPKIFDILGATNLLLFI